MLPTLQAWAAAAGLVFVSTGCFPWVGPVRFRIDTGEERHQFRILPYQSFGGVHGSSGVSWDSFLAPSGEDVSLGIWLRRPSFTGVGVNIYHPLFLQAGTSRDRLRAGPFRLPDLRPLRWSEHLPSHPLLNYRAAVDHLQTFQDEYLPLVPPEQRAELAACLPTLRELARRARFGGDDVHLWPDEAAARARLDALLASIEAAFGAGEARSDR
jgi:hypothetical protein